MKPAEQLFRGGVKAAKRLLQCKMTGVRDTREVKNVEALDLG
jgi:hypothetical protein